MKRWTVRLLAGITGLLGSSAVTCHSCHAEPDLDYRVLDGRHAAKGPQYNIHSKATSTRAAWHSLSVIIIIIDQHSGYETYWTSPDKPASMHPLHVPIEPPFVVRSLQQVFSLSHCCCHGSVSGAA